MYRHNMASPAKYEEFRERIRANWNDEQTVASWRRWHAKIAVQMRTVNDALLEAAQIRAGMRVLDLGSGSGEPALQIAHGVAPSGTVVATDISAGMLGVVRDHARAQELHNISFVQCDAEELPFDDETFDAVTSRMGAMFFVDLQRAFSEIRRVLRSGCRAAFAVWGPLERNTLFISMLQPFFRRIGEPPQPPADAPHPFRFAQPGALAEELRTAGFEDPREDISDMPTPWPGPPEEAWEMFYEMAAPPFVDELAQHERDAAIREAVESLKPAFDGNRIDTHASIAIASARKPHVMRRVPR